MEHCHVLSQAAGGFLSYFVVMGESGFLPYTLIGLRSSWDNPKTVVQDSYGLDWVREGEGRRERGSEEGRMRGIEGGGCEEGGREGR